MHLPASPSAPPLHGLVAGLTWFASICSIFRHCDGQRTCWRLSSDTCKMGALTRDPGFQPRCMLCCATRGRGDGEMRPTQAAARARSYQCTTERRKLNRVGEHPLATLNLNSDASPDHSMPPLLLSDIAPARTTPAFKTPGEHVRRRFSLMSLRLNALNSVPKPLDYAGLGLMFKCG